MADRMRLAPSPSVELLRPGGPAARASAAIMANIAAGFKENLVPELRGVVRGFDTFVILFDCDGKQEMIYKHAISTVIPQRKLEMNGRREAVTA